MNADKKTSTSVRRARRTTGVSPVSLLSENTGETPVVRAFHLRASAFICGLSLLLLTGCQTPKHVQEGTKAVRDYYDGNYSRAIERLEPLAEKTDENYVLNNLRLGSAALTSYELDEAEAAFLRAWEVIN